MGLLKLIVLIVVTVSAYALGESSLPFVHYNQTVVDAGCSYSACSAGGVSGVCVSISAGCCSGTVTSNLCPGSSDIKCCTNNHCSTSAGSGTCMQTSLCSSQGGKSIAGYCTGPSDLQCCVKGGGGISRCKYFKISSSSFCCPILLLLIKYHFSPTPIPPPYFNLAEIISRAQNWVDRKIPYSQTKTTDGYRQDCSGMVSMAWASSTSGGGHTTSTMQQICTKITKADMKKGDAILKPSEHVLLFDYWVDSDHFMEYAEHQTGTVASHDQTSYSYYANNGFFPCRYNLVA